MTTISLEEAQNRIARVLKEAGIAALLSGCSCCGEFDVTFPDGAKCRDIQVGWIDTKDVT